MELRQYIDIVRKRLIFIIIITLLCTSTAAFISYFILKPTYKSDISVIIGRIQNGQNVQDNINDVIMYQKMVKTYSEFAISRTVAEDVIRKLDLNMKPDALLGNLSVAPKGDTEFLTITFKHNDPEMAMRIANQVALSLKEVSYKIKKSDNVQLLDSARLPVKPDSPKPIFNIAVAFMFGLMLSISLVFLMEYLDSTIKSEEDIEKLTGLSVIGMIPFTNSNE